MIAVVLWIIVLFGIAFVLLFHELAQRIDERRQAPPPDVVANSRPIGNVDLLADSDRRSTRP